MLFCADVEVDAGQELFGDSFAAVEECGPGGFTDEVGQASHDSACALVEVVGVPGQGAFGVVAQAQGFFHVGDQVEPDGALFTGAAGQGGVKRPASWVPRGPLSRGEASTSTPA